ncbi:MAG: Asp23/Gls24 family envelope stress response protein [Eubacteriales bacterium]|nr:Asp23/Gls24 family envelope stress response protein [Eubacteriales bacterium]
MKGRINNQFGDVVISSDVIATIAGSAAVECFGVVGMAAVSIKDGFVKLLKRDSLHKGIEVSISEDNTVSLKLHIIVAYGVSIYAVSENLIENVRYQIEEHTGLKVESVNVFVESVRPID